ncbi:hypothetical protein D3C80_1274010 [compost metagenome]
MLLVRTQSLQLTALQYTQQLGLHGQRQLADFIEKQRAAIGQFELATAVVHRPGEGAANMAEQLAFHQGVGQRGAVEADDRFVGAGRGGMDGLGHQLLADPGFAGDQHGQVAAAHQAYFFDQALVGLALANHLAILLAAGLAVDLGALMLIFDPVVQPLDALGGVDRSGREAGEGLQGIQFDRFEALRVEGIEGQQAPWALVDEQRATHAVVDFQMIIQAIDQAVIGVRQVAVGSETGRAGAAEQRFETRVLADLEAPAEGVGTQAVDGQRHQPFTIKTQQGGGVAREQGAHGFQQASITFALGQFAGQVGDQGQQSSEQGFCSHSDSV